MHIRNRRSPWRILRLTWRYKLRALGCALRGHAYRIEDCGFDQTYLLGCRRCGTYFETWSPTRLNPWEGTLPRKFSC